MRDCKIVLQDAERSDGFVMFNEKDPDGAITVLLSKKTDAATLLHEALHAYFIAHYPESAYADEDNHEVAALLVEMLLCPEAGYDTFYESRLDLCSLSVVLAVGGCAADVQYGRRSLKATLNDLLAGADTQNATDNKETRS